jgi:hypothetical protein
VPSVSTPDSPLQPEQVPGPDTSGKGNLLTSIAKPGECRAAQELVRRGRGVLYVPSDSGDYMDASAFQRLLQGTFGHDQQ